MYLSSPKEELEFCLSLSEPSFQIYKILMIVIIAPSKGVIKMKCHME